MRMRGYEIKLKLIEEGKEKLAEKQVRELRLPTTRVFGDWAKNVPILLRREHFFLLTNHSI